MGFIHKNGLLSYGREKHSDGFVSIFDAKRGIACELICPVCYGDLIAKKGNVYQWHFAHFTDSGCQNAQESALHKFGKDVIFDGGVVPYPSETTLDLSFYNSLEITRIAKEERLFGIKPDIVVEAFDSQNQKQVFIAIEVYVTNPISPKKFDTIERELIPTIKVDLSEFIDDIPSDSIAKSIICGKLSSFIFEPNSGYRHPSFIKPDTSLEPQNIIRVQQTEDAYYEFKQADHLRQNGKRLKHAPFQSNAFTIISQYIEEMENGCGVKLLMEDKRFLVNMILAYYGCDLFTVLQMYFNIWVSSSNLVGSDIKRDNYGRKAANEWLRSEEGAAVLEMDWCGCWPWYG